MPRRRHAAVCLLALAAVVAGCNTGPAPTGTGTETLTPAPTVEPPATGADDGRGVDRPPAPALPPGVTERGLVDATALWAADARALRRSGYVAVMEVNGSRLGDGGQRASPPAPGWARRVARVEAGGERGLVTITRRGGGSVERRAVWFDGNGTLDRARAAEAVPVLVTVRRNGSDARGRNRAVGPLLRDLVAVGNYEGVTGTAGGTATRLYAGNATLAVPPNAPRNVTDYEGEVVVDPAGRVRSVRIRLVVTDGEPFEYRVRYRLRRVGNVTVERPAWAERSG